jgi:hypothetical protein
MGQRIRLLEDALAIFQSSVSNECHPLLRHELLAIKFGPEKGYKPDGELLKPETFIDSIDALGTLTISDHGEGPYFGRSAGSEVCTFKLSRRLCTVLTVSSDTVFGAAIVDIENLVA